MTSPAGWYQDPANPPGHLRYWDGARWTAHRALPSRAPAPAVGATPGGTGGWFREHKLLTALVALVVLGWTLDAAAGDDPAADPPPAGDAERRDQSAGELPDGTGDKGSRAQEPARRASKGDKARATPGKRHREPRADPSPGSSPRPHRAAGGDVYLVTRVIDGDTIELGNGADVRIVGIDTPETGECGYDAATANLTRLVLNKRVQLTLSDEDTDRYGRWLRYVDVGPVDAGLQQIRGGFAIARYDSRDGYGFHVREPRYIAADRASRNRSCPAPAPVAAPVPATNGGACAPGYSPCVPPFPPDVDCAHVDGPVRVTGADPHGLDADGDGLACE